VLVDHIQGTDLPLGFVFFYLVQQPRVVDQIGVDAVDRESYLNLGRCFQNGSICVNVDGRTGDTVRRSNPLGEYFEQFDDAYLGEFDSLEAYAEQLMEDLGYNQLIDETLPEHIRRYVEINVAGLAQDLRLSGDVYTYQRDGGGVWIFDGR